MMMKIHSEPPGMANKNGLFDNMILIFDRQQIYSFFYGKGSGRHKKNPARSGINNNLWEGLTNSFFLDPCAFTAACSEEVELGPAYLTGFVQNYRINIGRCNGKGSFHTNTIRDFSDRKCGGATLALAFDYIAFKALDTLLVAFDNLIIDSDVVSSLELGKVVGGGQLLVYKCNCLVHNLKFGGQK